MPPNLTSTTPDQLTGLAWRPPCDYSGHNRLAHQGAAEWIVWRTASAPCGAPWRFPVILLCDQCWNHLQGSRVKCRKCRLVYPFNISVVRVERFGGGS